MIPITNLVDIIKESRSSQVYRDLYDKISDLFVPVYERVISVLKDARKKFSELNLEIQANDIDWVINKINSQDIYNCNFNYDFLNGINNNDYAEFENNMKLIQEYSSDQFTKSKKEDVLEVKRLSNIRKQIKENSQQKNKFFQTNKSVKNMSCSNFMEKKGVSSYAQLANDLKIMNMRRSTVLNEDLIESGFNCGAGNIYSDKKEIKECQSIQEIKENNFRNIKRRKHGSNCFYWSNQRSSFKINEEKRKEALTSLNLVKIEKANFKNLLKLNNEFNNSNINNTNNNIYIVNKVNDTNLYYSEKCKILESEDYKNIGASIRNKEKLNKLNSDLKMQKIRKNSTRRSLENNLDLLNRESYSDQDANLNDNYVNDLNTTCQFNLGDCSNRSSLKRGKLPAFFINENENEDNLNISDNEKSFSKSKSFNSDCEINNNKEEASSETLKKIRQNQSNKKNRFQRFSISRFSIFKSNQSFSNKNNFSNTNNNNEPNQYNINNNNNNNNNNLNLTDLNFPALKIDSPNNSLNYHLEKYFKKFESNDFDVFEYAEACGRENVLINISDYLFEKNSLYVFISKKRFETFIDKIRLGYDYLLPYHNDLHAVDVLQTCSIFMKYLDLIESFQLTFLDVCGFLIAAIIHDFKHPGLNNSFQINKKTKLANKYNDVSVLENYHVSAAFKIISKPNSNIFKDLQVEEYRVVRKRIVECVLATDMAKHTKAQTSLRMKLDSLKRMEQDKDNEICYSDMNVEKMNEKGKKKNLLLENLVNNLDVDNKFDRQQEILNFLIHSADISNPTKPFSICKVWTELVMEEFFLQGDLEKKKGLPVSFLCDRYTTNIPKSQIAFISNIAMPNFKILAMLSDNCNIFFDNLITNIENWKKEDEKIQQKVAT